MLARFQGLSGRWLCQRKAGTQLLNVQCLDEMQTLDELL